MVSLLVNLDSVALTGSGEQFDVRSVTGCPHRTVGADDPDVVEQVVDLEADGKVRALAILLRERCPRCPAAPRIPARRIPEEDGFDVTGTRSLIPPTDRRNDVNVVKMPLTASETLGIVEPLGTVVPIATEIVELVVQGKDGMTDSAIG